MLADTHAHLYWPDFKADLEVVLSRAKQASLGIIINVGVDVNLSKKALNQVEEMLSNLSDINFYSSIGIHPHEAAKYSDNPDQSIQKEIEELIKIYQSNPKKVVAVGEIGLDYFFKSNTDFIPNNLSIEENKSLQKKLFKAQIDLAKKLNLPLLIHVRDDRASDPLNVECWEEAFDLCQDHFGVLHCYSGLEGVTRRALGLKYLISFAANITYPKNDYLREAAKIIPLEKIVLETDSPFLSPQSKRGQRNEPSAVLEIAKTIAQIKDVSLEVVEEQTTLNVKKMFKLPQA